MANPVIIENPILNSPFREPDRHFRFDDTGITNEIETSRRTSSYFIPIPKPRKSNQKNLILDTEWTESQKKETKLVNDIRLRVGKWRQGGHVGITPITARLLQYWTAPEREKKLFFCQIEALETLIYLTEVAHKYGDGWIDNQLRDENEQFNSSLPRLGVKMATGSGKTVVMGMIIAWQTLNKLNSPQDARFSDAFLIVTPGITIRDRLRVLLPNDPDNYYKQRDLLPPELGERLGHAKIVITNFHAFKPREKYQAAKNTKSILGVDKTGAFIESPEQMVRRVCRELGNKKNLIILNDEAHHCYQNKPTAEDELDFLPLTGEDRIEAKKRDEEARVWFTGLQAVKKKIGIRGIYDLSATPFFLKGSSYKEGTIFPWVVSDFSLIDAIECGIVKVPRVPVSDNAMTGDQPTYRDLWYRVRDGLPKKGRTDAALSGDPKLPAELEGALESLYSNYEKYYKKWEANTKAREQGLTPPVFIVVCNNTAVSKLVFDYIAGYEKTMPGDVIVRVPGKLPLFSNVEDDRWSSRPTSILVDSEQLESGEGMSAEFKKMVAVEIEEFKEEYRIRFPGRDVESLSEEDLLREVMNTVGKPGKLGEQVKCVVSVSMLTEGWDANTVTHVLGIRAFGTQLLCEQVVGRALRRMSYAVNAEGKFDPEYAEVYGVPFSFIPTTGAIVEITAGLQPTHVRALDERKELTITFPLLTGYKYEIEDARLEPRFTDESRFVLNTQLLPTMTENAPIVGEGSIHTLYGLKDKRINQVAFELARVTLENYFRDETGGVKPWLFPQILKISQRWLDECVTIQDDCFPQMFLLKELAHKASDKIYGSIVAGKEQAQRLRPILRPYDPIGTTAGVDFHTLKNTWTTKADKCHISHMVADTRDWEQKLAQSLEEMPEVRRYVKNDRLGFLIPYTYAGEARNYLPDFIIQLDDGHGEGDPLNLIIEVTGEKKKEKEIKVATARDLWVPAVNNHGGLGRWGFIEVIDPWAIKGTLQSAIGGAI